jgi:ATP-dependent helicase HrpB
VGGRGLAFDDELALPGWPLFVALDVDAGRRGRRAEARVRLACGVREEWLETTVEVSVAFDEAAERVVAVERECYRDLVLRERPVQADPEAAARILAEAAAAQPERALGLDPPREDVVARFLARLRCLAEWMPELDLPSVTGPDLVALLPALCAGRRSFDELRQAPLLDVLRARLSHEQRRALAREAPERLEIPSGRRVRLEYEVGRPPVLAARIQELFGLAETPRVGGGRVPVMVHLLAPNLRPQQVTQDLKSFWDRTYQEVRKELRRRYPKHAWPEDPWSAEPERRPRRRRRRRR